MIIGDSAWPPATYPTEFNGLPVIGWCVYIGGNTPHVWTDAEIQNLKAQPHIRYLLPIFTRSHPQGADAVADATVAVAWAEAHGQPAGTLIMWDYETAVDSAYERDVDGYLRSYSFHEVLYGSKSTVTQNARPSGGYDEAAWTGADYAPGDTGDQFVDVGAYDLNEFRSTAPLWDLHPAPVAPSVPQPEEIDMLKDSTIIRLTDSKDVYLLHPSGKVWHITTIPSLEGYIKAGCVEHTMDSAELANLKAA